MTCARIHSAQHQQVLSNLQTTDVSEMRHSSKLLDLLVLEAL